MDDSPQQNLNSLCYSGLYERLGRVVCPIIELFCSVGYEQGWVNDSVTSLFQMNAYVLVQSLSHTNTCIIAEYVITAQRS